MKLSKETWDMFNGFKKFILRGNVVDLAVGLAIGAAFNGVVTALVKDLITPTVSAIARVPDLSQLSFTLNGATFLYGDFLNVVISFVLTAAVIYFFVVTPMNTLVSRFRHEETPDPTTKKCPECYSEIPIKARRCAHCAQPVPLDPPRAEVHPHSGK